MLFTRRTIRHHAAFLAPDCELMIPDLSDNEPKPDRGCSDMTIETNAEVLRGVRGTPQNSVNPLVGFKRAIDRVVKRLGDETERIEKVALAGAVPSD